MNSNIGLCFKTFVGRRTNDERLTIIEEFLRSIIEFTEQITIIGVVDNFIDYRLFRLIKKYQQIKFLILDKNYGIAIATNIGIEYLIQNNCNYIFCSDDDIIIKDSNIFNKYVDAINQSKIEHLGFYPVQFFKHALEKQGDLIKITKGFSGCFYVVSKKCIIENGYLPVLDSKYGHEHVLYTKKVTGKQFDIPESSKLLELNPKSLIFHSGMREENTIQNYSYIKTKEKNFWYNKIKHPYFIN